MYLHLFVVPQFVVGLLGNEQSTESHPLHSRLFEKTALKLKKDKTNITKIKRFST